MTKLDTETGLPILGGDANSNHMPIDPKVLPDLREADEEVNKARNIGRQVGYQLVMMLASASAIGPNVVAIEKRYQDVITNIFKLHGVDPDNVLDIDIEKGLIVLK